ncbi:hypothetical protein PK28_12200 [Hymenobacter sp. DG25B]|jgi:hypothetical protein|uniref:hypothetical protein n=1 Tax=Hymenobacter sp. DG25B TaxID=1385664 RepID=UPI00054106A7|nr:hypothetical protein [Hymenobacter sp. DG25B]AIZ64257.1 hypothetical protein PK28_12200 [Hymenobacter sp. DG25B]
MKDAQNNPKQQDEKTYSTKTGSTASPITGAVERYSTDPEGDAAVTTSKIADQVDQEKIKKDSTSTTTENKAGNKA